MKYAETEKIVGKIVYTKFSNETFSIVVIEKQNGELINAKGYNLPDDKLTYIFIGKTMEEKKYGDTFNIDMFEIYVSSKSDIVKYLSKNISGVGSKTAEKFFDMYGPEEILNALKDKEKIAKIVKSQKTIDKIYESANFNLVDKEFFFFMQKYEIGTSTISNIAKSLQNPYKEVTKNPFVLCDFNISFNKMNKMSIDLGVKIKSSIRIFCAIRYYLREQIGSRGHLFSYYNDVVTGTLKILNNNISEENLCSKGNINYVLRKMKENGSIHVQKINGECVIYDSKNYESEESIAKGLVELVKNKPSRQFSTQELKPYIQKYEKILNVNLSEKQKLAIQKIINENVSIITGSAGTGKTTVLKFCIEIFKDIYHTDDILLLAPTGRAARRMAEKTKWNASTIHSRLKIVDTGDSIDYEGIFEKICFVDEMSMTGNFITYTLISNSSAQTRFVFLGDPQQLPSVESGNILSDMIESGVIPVVKLDVIYRQCKESLIISNANKITAGISDFQTGEDFVFVDKTGSIEIQKLVIEKFCEELFDNVGDIMEVQIITPMKERGYLSAKAINLEIQKTIIENNNFRSSIKCNGYEFLVKDKVMCQKNTDVVKNGDIGIITDIYEDPETRKMVAEIDFWGERYTFSKDRLIELKFVLAYAVTVHSMTRSYMKSIGMINHLIINS